MVGKLPSTVSCKGVITFEQGKLIGRHLLQDGAATGTKRAITANRIGQVSLDLKSYEATMARSEVSIHSLAAFLRVILPAYRRINLAKITKRMPQVVVGITVIRVFINCFVQPLDGFTVVSLQLQSVTHVIK